MPHPVVFISSTVRDLHDLRSAIRYWLEQLGFDVRLNEYNDFERRPDSATFDACFEAIASSDYYVLLVGDRVGNDYADGVSVTQQEFRVAMAASSNGRPHVIPFVRNEVRAALMSTDDREAGNALDRTLTRYDPEKATRNATRIRAFVAEIDATAPPNVDRATEGGLWTYKFGRFADIVDTLRIMLRADQSIRRQTLLANLEADLLANIAGLTVKERGRPLPGAWFMKATRNRRAVRTGEFDKHLTLGLHEVQALAMLLMFGPGSIVGIRTAALNDAIGSGEFLSFDLARRQFVPSPELEAMRRLRQEIARCRDWVEVFRRSPFSDETGRMFEAMRRGDGTVTVPGYVPLNLFAFYDTMENVLRLLVSLYTWIHLGGTYTLPQLHPGSPDPDAAQGIAAEQVSTEELERWLALPYLRDHFTGLQSASNADVIAALQAFPEFVPPASPEVQKEVEAVAGEFAERFPELKERSERDGQEAALEWLRTVASPAMRRYIDQPSAG